MMLEFSSSALSRVRNDGVLWFTGRKAEVVWRDVPSKREVSNAASEPQARNNFNFRVTLVPTLFTSTPSPSFP